MPDCSAEPLSTCWFDGLHIVARIAEIVALTGSAIAGTPITETCAIDDAVPSAKTKKTNVSHDARMMRVTSWRLHAELVSMACTFVRAPLETQ